MGQTNEQGCEAELNAGVRAMPRIRELRARVINAKTVAAVMASVFDKDSLPEAKHVHSGVKAACTSFIDWLDELFPECKE